MPIVPMQMPRHCQCLDLAREQRVDDEHPNRYARHNQRRETGLQLHFAPGQRSVADDEQQHSGDDDRFEFGDANRRHTFALRRKNRDPQQRAGNKVARTRHEQRRNTLYGDANPQKRRTPEYPHRTKRDKRERRERRLA